MNLKLDSVGVFPEDLSMDKFVDTNMLLKARSTVGALPDCLRLSATSPFPNAYIPKPRYISTSENFCFLTKVAGIYIGT